MPGLTTTTMHTRASQLLFMAAMLLASACGGSGLVQNRAPPISPLLDTQPKGDPLTQPKTPPPEETTPTEDDPPEETEFDLQDAFGIDGVHLNLLRLPVAQASDEIEFMPDVDVQVPGRLELVQKLKDCLGASDSSCTRATGYLYLGEHKSRPDHRENVSLAIQTAAGADGASDYFPADITYISVAYPTAINLGIGSGFIKQGAWINWSRESSFGGDYGFDPAILIANSVVVAIATENKRRNNPYTQSSDGADPRADELLDEAVLNTAVIFVYGLHFTGANDIYINSSRCGTQIMHACIGVVYSAPLQLEGGGTRYFRGTSNSTGLLSGTAWVMKSLWPHLTSRQIAAIMLATARQLRGGVNEYTGVGALDFTKLFEPVGPMTAKELGVDDLVLERGFLHLPGLTEFDNPEGVDRFARNFQLATSTLAIQPGFADFDLDRFTPAVPGSRLHLAVNKNAGGAEDAALAFGHTNKLVLSSRYIGLCRDGQNTDLCLTTTRREDFFGGQGSGSFSLEDTTYTSLAATHQMPIRDRLELGFSAALTDARTSGKHLVGEVKGRLLQAEFSLLSKSNTRSRKSRTSLSIWASKFDGSMGLLGKQSRLHDRSYGARLHWRLDF